MSTLLLSDGRELPVPEALKRELDAASIESAAQIAQVADADLSPALLLITGGDVAYVTRQGTQRWPACELKRIEANDVVPIAGPAVTIGSWGAASERADFLRAAAALLGRKAVEPVSAGETEAASGDPATPRHRWRAGTHALIAGCLSAVIAGLGLATASAFAFNDPHHTELLESFLISVAAFGPLLLIAGVGLARRESPWHEVGRLGAMIGGLATVALIPAIAAIAYLSPNLGA